MAAKCFVSCFRAAKFSVSCFQFLQKKKTIIMNMYNLFRINWTENDIKMTEIDIKMTELDIKMTEIDIKMIENGSLFIKNESKMGSTTHFYIKQYFRITQTFTRREIWSIEWFFIKFSTNWGKVTCFDEIAVPCTVNQFKNFSDIKLANFFKWPKNHLNLLKTVQKHVFICFWVFHHHFGVVFEGLGLVTA